MGEKDDADSGDEGKAEAGRQNWPRSRQSTLSIVDRYIREVVLIETSIFELIVDRAQWRDVSSY